MRLTKRIQSIPPYLFARIDQKKAEARAKGTDLIDLGIGDPDLPTPKFVLEAMSQAIQNPANHSYPPYDGTDAFKIAISEWFLGRFGVALDPKNEVLALIGSKEGIAHSFLTFLDPGDVAILPNPGYPAYAVNTVIAGGDPYEVPVGAESNYQIDFSKLDPRRVAKAKLLVLNYPGNPTSAIASEAYLEEAVAFCLKRDILILMDLAYSEVAFDGYKPPSILSIKGAKDIAIEFHSFSKTFNMTGWRVGFVCGNAQAVQALGKLKPNMDSGVFKAVQQAAIEALPHAEAFTQEQNLLYQARRDIVVAGLNQLGWQLEKPKATFYVWAPVPKGYTSEAFTMMLLDTTGILVVPGNGYGSAGEGYFRISITTPTERLIEAMKRLKDHGIRYS